MRRALLGLALLTAALFAATRALEGGGGEVREVPLPRLVDEREAAALSVAGVSIDYGDEGPRFVYAQREGLWRCTTAYDAPALSSRVEDLTRELVEARGMSRGPLAGHEASFGLDEAQRVVVRLHGARMFEEPGGDVLLEVELGHSLPGVGGGRGFARLAGAHEVLEIQYDLRARLARDSEGGLPPLLDGRLLAGEFPDRGGGLERAFIDLADGTSLDLESELRAVPGLPQEEWPRDWSAITGETRLRCLPYRIAGWQAFLYRAPISGLSDPAAAERRGLDPPVAVVTLAQVDAAPIVLRVGRPAPSGGRFVENRKTGQLVYLEPEVAALLLPTLEGLAERELQNPWEAWLPR